jgi:hypothetical protein
MAIHHIKGKTIRTDFIYPPIPDRQFDWCAVNDDTYDGEGCLIGYGEDEQAAIDDLLHLIDESGEVEPDEFDHQAARWDHQRDLRKHS